MIRNKFVFELSYKFDTDKLLELIKNKRPQPDLSHFQYPCNIDNYTINIQKEFPFLAQVFNVYKSIKNYNSPIHIDAHRNAAINIPLYGTSDSYTVFYEKSDKIDTEYNPSQFLYLVKSKVNELYRFTLSKPTLINTTYPHSVINGPNLRAILSWTISPKYSYDQIVELLKK